MRRTFLGLAACGLVAAGVILYLCYPSRAASPTTGTWKVVIREPQADLSIWLLKIDEKDGKPQASVVASGIPALKDVTVENARLEDKAFRATLKANDLTFDLVAYVPQGEEAPKKLLGSVAVEGQRIFLQMERTDLKELDPKKVSETSPAGEALEKAGQTRDLKEREAQFKDIVTRFPDQPAAYAAALQLLRKIDNQPEAKELADKAIKVGTAFGPEMQLHVTKQVAELLVAGKAAPAAVEYARQAVKLLPKDAPAAAEVAALKTLRAALRKADKADEAKELTARITKLDEQLDQEFLKNAIPFKPEAYPGRAAKSDRAVVVELFTGVQCPPCVAADVAFDALLKTYKPAEVIFLQYHQHIPGPDPLTNGDGDKRGEFYKIEGTPAFYINGKDGPGAGGPRSRGQQAYDALRKTLDKEVETDAGAKLKLTASRKDDQIDITAEVSDLTAPGEDTRLCFVLVEDVVSFPGRNGQRVHHHVVRFMPGGPAGFALKDKSSKQTWKGTLGDVRKAINEHLDKTTDKEFGEDDRPMDLKHLKVVALIQDNKTKEILQAAQVDLGGAK